MPPVPSTRAAAPQSLEECLEVQRTNDESCVSKRSAARLGYIDDDFLRFFVRRPARRSPLINRGYYARMAAMREIQSAFLEEHANVPCQILSLGAGFDTAYFHWASKHLEQVVRFFEVDYPTLVERKKTLILDQPPLAELLRGVVHTEPTSLRSDNYALIGADLRCLTELRASLDACGFDVLLPTLVLAECVLQYLQPSESDEVLHWVQATLPRAQVAVFDQIEGGDAFGGVMTGNLRNRGSPLYGLSKYNTTDDQQRRYEGLGFSRVFVTTLHGWWETRLGDAERLRVEGLEPFDEWEEWRVTCLHYCITTANNHGACQSELPPSTCHVSAVFEPEIPEVWPEGPVSWSDDPGSSFSGWGHSCCEWPSEESAVVFGGYVSGGRGAAPAARTNAVWLHHPSNGFGPLRCQGDSPCPRMHHAACVLGYSMVVFGGRTNPSAALGDTHALDLRRLEWTALHTLGMAAPPPRWRHILTTVAPETALLLGGRGLGAEGRTTFGDAWLLVRSGERCVHWVPVAPPPEFAPRCSHIALLLSANTVLVHGGLDANDRMLDDTWILSLDILTHTCTWAHIPGPAPRLFSHAAVALPRGALVLGGLGDHVDRPLAHRFDAESHMWSRVPILAPPTPRPPLLARHTAARVRSQMTLIGGGAVCFSFGTAFTPILRLNLDGEPRRSYSSLRSPSPGATVIAGVDVAPAVQSQCDPQNITSPISIRRVVDPSEAEWLDLVGRRVPGLFGGCDLGPCLKLWSPEYLIEREGHTTVGVHRTGSDRLDFLKKNFQIVQMPFAELLRCTFQSGATEKLYFRSVGAHQTPSDLAGLFPAIGADFVVPPFMGRTVHPATIHQSVLRVGAPGIHMWLHYDILDNILCQIRGTKRIILFPPSEIRNLYFSGSVSRVMDLDAPHQPAFPLFAQAQGAHIELTMVEGDVLFIPALWPHSTVGLTPSVSVNVFFRHLPEGQYDKKDIYGNKDLLLGQRAKQEAAKLRDTLQQLPAPYRDFYKQIVVQMLEEP